MMPRAARSCTARSDTPSVSASSRPFNASVCTEEPPQNFLRSVKCRAAATPLWSRRTGTRRRLSPSPIDRGHASAPPSASRYDPRIGETMRPARFKRESHGRTVVSRRPLAAMMSPTFDAPPRRAAITRSTSVSGRNVAALRVTLPLFLGALHSVAILQAASVTLFERCICLLSLCFATRRRVFSRRRMLQRSRRSARLSSRGVRVVIRLPSAAISAASIPTSSASRPASIAEISRSVIAGSARISARSASLISAPGGSWRRTPLASRRHRSIPSRWCSASAPTRAQPTGSDRTP